MRHAQAPPFDNAIHRSNVRGALSHLLLAGSVNIDGNQLLLRGGEVLQVGHQVLPNLLPCVDQQKDHLQSKKCHLSSAVLGEGLYMECGTTKFRRVPCTSTEDKYGQAHNARLWNSRDWS